MLRRWVRTLFEFRLDKENAELKIREAWSPFDFVVTSAKFRVLFDRPGLNWPGGRSM